MWEIDEDAEKMPPIHHGEILDEEFLKPLGMTKYRLAKSIGVDPRRINAIVQGKCAITAETAIKLSHFFGTSANLWMGIQTDYDLNVAMDKMGVTLPEYEDIPVNDELDIDAVSPPATRGSASAAMGG